MADTSDSEWDEEVILDQGGHEVASPLVPPPPPPTPPPERAIEVVVNNGAVVNQGSTKGRVLMPWRKDPALILCLFKLAITDGYH